MNLTIKLLTQKGVIFMPLTVSEAVLVKDNEQVITLDQILEKKLENILTPAGSGLDTYKLGKSVIITHTNKIAASGSVSPLQVLYDGNGHIISSKPLGKTTVLVNNDTYAVLDGSTDNTIQFGDDFNKDDTNNIKLQWNNL